MKIAVALSGGVDSATALYLLKKKDHNVFALFMKNWEEKTLNGECQTAKDADDARRVCAELGVPLYTINFTKQYYENVFSQFLDKLKKGCTPNPDTLCNKEIKFNLLLKKALELGASYLATGHYCINDSGILHKGLDPNKDQSYFLYALKRSILEKVLFPIGHYKKGEVRAIAENAGLCVSKKKDSTGICFIGKRNFKKFLESYIPNKKGKVITTEGKYIGNHDGIYYYTLGQRKGINIGGTTRPLYIAKKNHCKNELIVAEGSNHPALFTSTLKVNEVSWIDKEPCFPLKCNAKIRYRQIEQPCIVEKKGSFLSVTFEKPQRAVTPCQSVVFYHETTCLGGGLIQ